MHIEYINLNVFLLRLQINAVNGIKFVKNLTDDKI